MTLDDLRPELRRRFGRLRNRWVFLVQIGVAVLLAWVPTDWWEPTVGEAESPRELFLYGGDRNGAFRKRVGYAWGRIAVGDKERKKKHKGQREPTY